MQRTIISKHGTYTQARAAMVLEAFPDKTILAAEGPESMFGRGTIKRGPLAAIYGVRRLANGVFAAYVRS